MLFVYVLYRIRPLIFFFLIKVVPIIQIEFNLLCDWYIRYTLVLNERKLTNYQLIRKTSGIVLSTSPPVSSQPTPAGHIHQIGNMSERIMMNDGK